MMSYWCTFWQQNNYIQHRFQINFHIIIQIIQLDMLEYYLIIRCKKMVQKKITPPFKYPCIRTWPLRLQRSAFPGAQGLVGQEEACDKTKGRISDKMCGMGLWLGCLHALWMIIQGKIIAYIQYRAIRK